MSTATLTSLIDYLTGTLSTSDMRWVGEQLTNRANQQKPAMKRYTMEEINAMLDEAERGIAAGEGIPDEEAWGELEALEQEELEFAEAV